MNIIFRKRNKKTGASRSCGVTVFVKSVILIFIVSVRVLNVVGQSSGQHLALAEKYFAAGEYYTAAGLYEQYLNPVKKNTPGANFPLNAKRYRTGGSGMQLSKTAVLLKQADSYRLANYFNDAAEKYKQCFEKDNTHYSDAMYWYAVCKRSLGEYKEAEDYLSRYLANNRGENNFIAAAKKELETVQYINNQLKRPDTILYHIQRINTSFGNEKGVYAPLLIKGNQFLFTGTKTDSVVKPGINPSHNRLFAASIENNSITINEPLSIEGIDDDASQGAASLSADGNFLYFTQWKKEKGKNISAIYFASKKGNEWGSPVKLSSINADGFSSKQPFCSADGKNLFFASDKPGGAGGFDIWYASLHSDGTTGTSMNAGNINTANDEQAPFYHGTSNTLVFASNGRLGMGGFDLFSSKMKGAQWSTPENMGHPVNSSRDDIYFFAPEGQELLRNSMFSSDRGSNCCLATYAVAKSPKKKLIAGIVKDLKHNEPVADAVVIMKDASGKSRQTTTTPDGKFSFELSGDPAQNVFTVTKDKYNDKTSEAVIENVNESDWLTDVVNNVPILIEKKFMIKPENVVTIYFDFNKSKIKKRGIEVLDSIYNVLTKSEAATIQISGFTDGLGSNEYNFKLSNKRAKACADYFIRKGIDTNRITFISFGKCCPMEMELINGRDNPDGRTKNRRAMINVNKD
ncbi:MAG: OmpA family protein [Sphingobacteriales bacterium]